MMVLFIVGWEEYSGLLGDNDGYQWIRWDVNWGSRINNNDTVRFDGVTDVILHGFYSNKGRRLSFDNKVVDKTNKTVTFTTNSAGITGETSYQGYALAIIRS